MAALAHRHDCGAGHQLPEPPDARVINPLATGVIGQQQQPVAGQSPQVIRNRQIVPHPVKSGLRFGVALQLRPPVGQQADAAVYKSPERLILPVPESGAVAIGVKHRLPAGPYGTLHPGAFRAALQILPRRGGRVIANPRFHQNRRPDTARRQRCGGDNRRQPARRMSDDPRLFQPQGGDYRRQVLARVFKAIALVGAVRVPVPPLVKGQHTIARRQPPGDGLPGRRAQPGSVQHQQRRARRIIAPLQIVMTDAVGVNEPADAGAWMRIGGHSAILKNHRRVVFARLLRARI